jgi:GTP pyrophosphokinase
MKPTSIVERAEAHARAAHAGRLRVGGEPEVEHLRRVAELAGAHGGEFAAAVGWLHDIIEDCGVTALELQSIYGSQIARAVVELTDDPALVGMGHDWRSKRKQALACVMGEPAVIVKLADVIDNAASMREHKPNYFEAWADKTMRLLDAMPREMTLYHAQMYARAQSALNPPTQDQTP